MNWRLKATIACIGIVAALGVAGWLSPVAYLSLLALCGGIGLFKAHALSDVLLRMIEESSRPGRLTQFRVHLIRIPGWVIGCRLAGAGFLIFSGFGLVEQFRG